MPMQDKAASQRNFLEASNSRFEPLLIKTLCEPLLPYIPARLHPSTISFVTHGLVWASALLAAASPSHAPLGRALSLIGAGIGVFLSMIGDCIEGLHARRTHQRTRFGALMGRWLDALVVPLATVGITSAMQLPTWALVTINVGAAMIYNAQVVHYHHSGEFLHPEPTNGIEAQLGLSIGYIVLAGLFYCVDRHRPWLDMSFAGLAALAAFIQLRCSAFYYPKLGRFVTEHLWFVATCTGFGIAFGIGAIDRSVFFAAIVFTSLRITGRYLICTFVDAQYNGRDRVLLGLMVAIFIAHFVASSATLGGIRITNLLAALGCAFVIAQNLQDLSRHYGALKPHAA